MPTEELELGPVAQWVNGRLHDPHATALAHDLEQVLRAVGRREAAASSSDETSQTRSSETLSESLLLRTIVEEFVRQRGRDRDVAFGSIAKPHLFADKTFSFVRTSPTDPRAATREPAS